MQFWQKTGLRLRQFGLEAYAFLTAPFVIRNCFSMILVLGGIFLLSFWWLQCYTHHGESVQVPNYVGMSFREAAKKARARDFAVAISDSLYVPGKPPGEITAQNPAPDSRVKEGRTVYFTVTKNNPDVIRLPDLAGGDDYDLYSRKLSRLGLKPRIVARVPDPRLEPNTIVAVVYRNDTITNKIRKGNYSLEMGATVDFIVSEKVSLTVAMPECECQTFGAAKFLLQASSLSLGSVIKDGTVTDEQTAYVWRQSPRYDANSTMRVGEQVDLYLTQQRPQKCAANTLPEGDNQ